MTIYDLALLNLDEATLLGIKTDMIAEIRSGKGAFITSVNAPGLSNTFQMYGTPFEIANAAQYALGMVSSSVYGLPLQNQALGYTL